MVKFLAICGFLNFITSTICGLFVLLSNPKSKKNQTFCLYTLFVALWAGLQFLWFINSSKETILEYIRISNIAAIFIPPAFFHFSIYLINEYEKYSKFLRVTYIFSILISLTGFSKLYISNFEPLLPSTYWPIFGPTFTLMFIEYIFVLGYALYIILQKYRSENYPEKLKLKYVYYGILIAYLSGSTNFLLGYRIPIPPCTNILIPLYIIFITYAIFRYQLMDIKIIIKKSLVYTLLITVITVFYLISIYIAEHILESLFGYKSLFVSIASATFIALVFIPLRNFIQSFIEKTFFRGSYMKISEENDLLRQEVTQSDRMKSIAILASGMAHEIKNPLTPIKTFSEQLPSRLDDKEFLLRFSKIIGKEVDRIDSLVQELLIFAKPTPPQFKQINIYQLIEQILELLNNDFIRHKINLKTSFENKNITISIDPKQIKQALLNIFLNAIDALPNGGTLTVSTKTLPSNRQNYFIIEISDTGCGINSKDLPHIFDPFFSKKDHGTGLGLSITHEMIKNNNGKILAESELGKGTTLRIEFPL
jgi:signal transduction histidine kinase